MNFKLYGALQAQVSYEMGGKVEMSIGWIENEDLTYLILVTYKYIPSPPLLIISASIPVCEIFWLHDG